MTLQNDNIFFYIFDQLMRLFHLSSLLQMPSDHRMVDVELFGNFLCSCKRTSFNDGSQLVVVNFQRPATMLLTFKTLVSFEKLPEPPLHCTSVRSSWDNGVIDVASCLHCFTTQFELE